MTETETPFARPDGRAVDQLRPIHFETGIAPHALGSVLVSFEKTRVMLFLRGCLPYTPEHGRFLTWKHFACNRLFVGTTKQNVL